MTQNNQSGNESMTPMQKQAILVCVICALAALLTIGITLTLLQRGKPVDEIVAPESVPESTAGDDISSYYQVDNTSSALLTETEDAGTDYLNDTLFLGDSNTVRLYNNGLISLQQFCAKEGIGVQAALSEEIVSFKGDSQHYTIPQAVAMMKPRRVVLTFGTNDNGMDVSTFISHYAALVQAIQTSYPYTDIIVNTVPPIPQDHSTYPAMDQSKIDDFNMALLDMCEELGVKFLNSTEALKSENGYGNPDYYTSGDIHLKSGGQKAMLNYLRTHAYLTEDCRPDTSGIPTRTLEYVSNPSSAVAAPSSETSSSSEAVSVSEIESQSESPAGETLYTAHYQVERSGGGTLSSGSSTGKSTLTLNITSAAQAVKVTAEPAEGYVFVKWSDGSTSRTRTDTDFKQNLEVTAIFSAASVRISGELRGSIYTFRASVSGKYADTKNLRWYANGQEVTAAAGSANIQVDAGQTAAGTYKIYATVTYNDCSVASNTLNITVEAASSSVGSSSSGTSSGSSSGSSSSASSSSGSSSSGSTSSSASGSSSSASAEGSHSTSGATSGASSTHAGASGADSTSGSSSGPSSGSSSASSGTSSSDSVSSSTSASESTPASSASSTEAASPSASASESHASTETAASSGDSSASGAN